MDDHVQHLLEDIDKNIEFSFPLEYRSDLESYRQSLKRKIDLYIKELSGFQEKGEFRDYIASIIPCLEKFNTGLQSVLREYMSGRTSDAYESFENLMQAQQIHDSINQEPLLESASQYCELPNGIKSLYRIRVSEDQIDDRKEIFHIPFEKRHLVTNGRYSISGLPCLYLGSSIYVCWQEMGQPDFAEAYVSRFQVNGTSLKILDLAYSIETMKKSGLELFFKSEDKIEIQDKARLILWPLVAACSYKKANKNSPFNVEYVIPNLLLQWVSKNKDTVSGIKYFSTKMKQYKHSEVGFNYVFPPDTTCTENSDFKEKGFCQTLSKTFSLTKPSSLQTLSLLRNCAGQDESSRYHKCDNVDELIISHYDLTTFATIEKRLKDLTIDLIPTIVDDPGKSKSTK